MKIKQITKILTICEISILVKKIFRQFAKYIKLYSILPVMRTSAEDVFSTLNRLKTVPRHSLTQSRLNHCLIANMYKEKCNEIDPY